MRSAWLVIAIVTVVSSCSRGGVVISTPAPAQPELISVSLVGHRVCNTFNVTGAQFLFTCPPLPTIESTGWRLTPLERNNDWNASVTIRVRTPSATSLEIAYVLFTRSILTQISQAEARAMSMKPPPLGWNGLIQVEATDDGTNKTWAITTRVRQCNEVSKLEIVNTSSTRGRSNPLSLVILRSPNETGDCGGIDTSRKNEFSCVPPKVLRSGRCI